ncbi:MAG: hypothetical protein RLY30_1573, partial [Pseudomonadota bacterium]
TVKRWGWTGSSGDAADRLVSDMEKFINR